MKPSEALTAHRDELRLVSRYGLSRPALPEAIERATDDLQPVPDLAAFKQNPQVQDAVVRNIEIIGAQLTRSTAPGPRVVGDRFSLVAFKRG